MLRVAVELVSLMGLGFALPGCSIEGARQLDEPCLNSRECAIGLVCEFNATGNSRCARPNNFDGGFDALARDTPFAPVDGTAPVDGASPADGTSPVDTAVMEDPIASLEAG